MAKARPLVGIVCTALALVLVVGILTFASPCAASADGAALPCASAVRATIAAAVVALILSLVRIFEQDEGERRGLDVGIMLTSALAALTPGIVVDVCTGAEARCQLIMCPFVRVVAAAAAIVAAADLTIRLLSLVRHQGR